MKEALLLCAVLLLAASSFADTIINNFTGYNDGWNPFGDPAYATQTYGEIFTAPDGVNNLSSFSFYTGDPVPIYPGDIIAGAYIATWTGAHAGTLLYDSGKFDYDNLGNEQLTFNTNGVTMTPGQQYVMFLSTTKFHGQSFGATYVSDGSTNQYLDGFAYFNNYNFDTLFANNWDAYGLQPDMAVDLEFNTIPEPSSLLMLGTGILAGLGALRRKL